MEKRTKPNAVDIFVGGRIKARRVENGTSREKLGEAVGVTFQQVQKYEKGTNRISSSRLLQIADALGVSPPYFFEGSPAGKKKVVSIDVPSMEYIGDFISSAEGLKLVKAYLKIPKEVQRSIVNMVDKIAENEKDGRQDARIHARDFVRITLGRRRMDDKPA